MKTRHFIVLSVCLLWACVAGAQNQRFENALDFRVINQGFSQGLEEPFDRLPLSMKDSVRPDLWQRSKNTSGIGIRFRTNSTSIATKMELRWNFSMNHMSFVGIKGLDLYCLNDEGKWQFVNATRPKGKEQTFVLVENMEPAEREFMLFLPLYDGVLSLEIGVDSTATLMQPKVDSPRKEKKIVVYGTSITQGGCATRPGMCYSNIMCRDLDCEFINLGFSGEGKLDMVMAEALAKMDVNCYIIDCIPNCTLNDVEERAYNFVKYLREKRPEVPIVMVEGLLYPYSQYNTFFKKYLPEKNAALHDAFKALKKENKKNLYYMTCEGIVGYDEEGTVDGIHYTDIGFRRYADKMIPLLKKLIK